ncbi:Six-hairpin glycosidase [Rhizodiscina lignyota]|uniref:Six-hairpin glycosidase n=1 Tax=Rhizodiscina lignyota TaxID=1504668 RepID=A0A9P4IR78_9PEZI|nr:Six-hairpin glycosidase [Rhizodiscina lignyota]
MIFRYPCPIFFLSLFFVRRGWASSQPWEQYVYSPKFRSVAPASVKSISGDAVILSDEDGYVLSMNSGSQVSLDFGVEVGGLISFSYNSTVSGGTQVSLAYAESPSFVRSISDDTGPLPNMDYDRALNVTFAERSGSYTVPRANFRGGFRFLTINALQDVMLSNITCEIGFLPAQGDLRDYQGYFYTPNDKLLNRIWYAGAYTVQTNIAPQNTGRFLPQVKPGWAYNASLGVSTPILIDGAKRDRAVWPGDIGMSGLTGFLAHGDIGLTAVRNALDTLFYYQNSTGQFPFAGPDTASFHSGSQSNTYHAWTLISIYYYAIHSGDEAWLNSKWENIKLAVDLITAALHGDDLGLHNQTQPNDWARQGGGGYNSALNALDYQALTSIASLGAEVWPRNSTRTKQASAWSAAAERLKASFNSILWDSSSGLYRDNQTTSLHPQDGNALALLFNLTTSAAQASSLSRSLLRNWNSIGPITPELPDTISPFISGLEVLAHLTVGEASRALELVRRTWGYLLDSPLMTGSTLAEGITANGSLYYRSTAGYAYDASYTSLSHGWSSAPTSGLTNKVLGLEMTGWKTWRFAPLAGDLSEARGGFRTGFGKFDGGWKITNGKATSVEAWIDIPQATSGEVVLPWKCTSATMNGRAWSGTKVTGGGRKTFVGHGCM